MGFWRDAAKLDPEAWQQRELERLEAKLAKRPDSKVLASSVERARAKLAKLQQSPVPSTAEPPPARTAEPPSPAASEQWEYKDWEPDWRARLSLDREMRQLNELGQEGWEVVKKSEYSYLLKRRIVR
jgi:hypothetical protein